MSFRLVPKSVILNDLEQRNGRYCALSYRIWQSCQALSCSWSWRFLVLVLIFVLTCMVSFNNVWSCIMLLVTKLHKNLIHHESTIAWCPTLSCYVSMMSYTKLLRYVIYTCRYYIVFGILGWDFLYMPPLCLSAIIYIWLICVLRGRIYWKQ